MNQTVVGGILATVIAAGILWVGSSLAELQTGVVRIEERIVAVQSSMLAHDERIKALEADMTEVKLIHARESHNAQINPRAAR